MKKYGVVPVGIAPYFVYRLFCGLCLLDTKIRKWH